MLHLHISKIPHTKCQMWTLSQWALQTASQWAAWDPFKIHDAVWNLEHFLTSYHSNVFIPFTKSEDSFFWNVQIDSLFVLRADWNWYSSNRISFIDSWMEVKLKYGSVIMMLVSANSTYNPKTQIFPEKWMRRSNYIKIKSNLKILSTFWEEQPRHGSVRKWHCEQKWSNLNLEHFFSKQMIPHFSLDVPIDQITLKRKNRREHMIKNLNSLNTSPYVAWCSVQHVVTVPNLLEGENIKETGRIFDLIKLIGCEGF